MFLNVTGEFVFLLNYIMRTNAGLSPYTYSHIAPSISESESYIPVASVSLYFYWKCSLQFGLLTINFPSVNISECLIHNSGALDLLPYSGSTWFCGRNDKRVH